MKIVSFDHHGGHLTQRPCLLCGGTDAKLYLSVTKGGQLFRCHRDGFVFRTGDADGLRNCLREVLEMSSDRRRQVAVQCRKVVSAYTVQDAVEGILQAISRT